MTWRNEMPQRIEKASPSLAEKIFPNLRPKPAENKPGPIHGWGTASESVHRARGFVSPLGGQSKRSK
jgi:hypothetical protein